LNRQRGGSERRVEREALIVDRVVPAHTEIFVERRADGKLRTVKAGVEALIAVGESLLAEQIDAGGHALAEKPRIGESDIDALEY